MAGIAAAPAIRPLISAEAIARRVEELAQEIAAARLDNLIIVAVLKGSFIFAADLIRALHRQHMARALDRRDSCLRLQRRHPMHGGG